MRRYGWILLASAAWTTWVWVTRIGILFGSESAAFKAVHAVLILGSLGFAAATGWIGVRLLRRSRTADSAPREPAGARP